MSSCPNFVNWLKDDPLVYQGKITVKTALNILKNIDNVNKWLNLVSTPYLIIQGGDDCVVD